MIASIFLKAVNLAINASWLILAVIIVRLLIKKAPKWISCLLWGLVALRLLCPVSLESALSLLPSREVIPENIQMAEKPQIDSGFQIIDNTVNPVMENAFKPEPGNSADFMQMITSALSVIWVIGVGVMLIYAFSSFFLLKRKVRARLAVSDGIFECDEVRSPFIALIVVAVCFMTNPKPKPKSDKSLISQSEDIGKDNEKPSAENRAFLEAWGKMFVERNGDGILEHTTEDVRKSFRNRELLHGHKGSASFGISSPWPVGATDADKGPNGLENGDSGSSSSGNGSREPFRVVFQDDHNNSGDILYYASTSDPHMTVWQEHVDFRMDYGRYVVTHEELTYLDQISSVEEYDTAYPAINNTFMDYAKNGMGEALNKNVLLSSSWIYQDLSDPVKAARILLNLSDDEKKVQISVVDDEAHPKSCDIQIYFTEDKETRSLTMANPWKNGIWIPQDCESVSPAEEACAEAFSKGIFRKGSNRYRIKCFNQVKIAFNDEEEDCYVSGIHIF